MDQLLQTLPLLIAMALCVYGPKALPLVFVSIGSGRRSTALRAWLEYVSAAASPHPAQSTSPTPL